MCPITRSLLILNIILLLGVAADICDFNDVMCVTRAANKLLKEMSSGILGLVEALDPLHESRIVLNTSNIMALLTNVTLSGMKHCRVNLLSFKPIQLTYVYELRCPHFVFTNTYAIKGTLGSIHLDHEGSLQVTIHDYVITFKGKNGESISKEDNKTRLYIESYRIDTEPKRGITFKDTGVKKGDKTRVQSAWRYLSENWRNSSSVLSRPMMHNFMSKYIEILNRYLKKTPVEDVLAADKPE